MQQPSQPRNERRPPRRLPRHAAGTRAFAGMLLLLAFFTTTWQSAFGLQCQRRSAIAALQVEGIPGPGVNTAHSHMPAADAGAPASGFSCHVVADVVRAPDAAPDAGRGMPPQSSLARLETSTDPPALFRPPRLI